MQAHDLGKGKKKRHFAPHIPGLIAGVGRFSDPPNQDAIRRRKRPGPISCRDKIWALFSDEVCSQIHCIFSHYEIKYLFGYLDPMNILFV